MKHFLFAELYRMKSSKSPLILLLVCFGLSFTAGITYGIAFGNAPFLTDFYSFLFGGMDPGVTELLSGNHVDTLAEFAALGFN